MPPRLPFVLAASLTLGVSLACGVVSESPEGSGGAAAGGQLGTGASTTSGGGAPSPSGGASTGGTHTDGGSANPNTGGSSGDGGASDGSGGGTPDDAVPSAGCEAAAPAEGLRTIDVDGTEREYILTLPPDYDPTYPYRLIFGFHGAMYDAEWVANGEEPLTGPYFGLEEEAEGSAIFVAAQANPGWNAQDLTYVEAMLDSLESELCIDTSRVFSVGFSAGGIMTVRLGCAMGDVFRAIAPMSPNLPGDCEDGSEPIAYWSSHGMSDTTITPEQGALARDEFLERNGCSTDTEQSFPLDCVSYLGCSAGNPVGYCTFDGAHVPAPFAGVAIWAFFAQF